MTAHYFALSLIIKMIEKMTDLKLQGTPKTPTIEFDSVNGTLLIKGRSIPENAIEFFKPLMNVIEAYSLSPKPKTTVNIQLDYFNTISSRCILDIFLKLEGINKKDGSDVFINWYYDDEDLLEDGEDYQMVIQIPFKMIEVEED